MLTTKLCLSTFLAIAIVKVLFAAQADSTPRYKTLMIGDRVQDVISHAIDAKGDVVGQIDGEAFLRTSDGTIKLLGKLAPTGWGDNIIGGDGTSNYSSAYTLNNRGQIVGASGGFKPLVMSGLQDCVAFLYDNNRMLPIQSGSNPYSVTSYEALGINDNGSIVGRDGYRGFYFAHGQERTVNPLSSYDEYNGTVCNGINNIGWFVGASTVNRKIASKPKDQDYNNNVIHAFVCKGSYPDHKLIDVGTLPGYINSSANAVDDYGDVVGAATKSDQVDDKFSRIGQSCHAFLWRKGEITDLGVLPGEKTSEALGIANSNLIVGYSGSKPVLWTNTMIIDLSQFIPENDNVISEKAVAINRSGEIIIDEIQRLEDGHKNQSWLLKPLSGRYK